MGTVTLDDDDVWVDGEDASVRARLSRTVRRLPIGLLGAVSGAAVGLALAPVLYAAVLGGWHTVASANTPATSTAAVVQQSADSADDQLTRRALASADSDRASTAAPAGAARGHAPASAFRRSGAAETSSQVAASRPAPGRAPSTPGHLSGSQQTSPQASSAEQTGPAGASEFQSEYQSEYRSESAEQTGHTGAAASSDD